MDKSDRIPGLLTIEEVSEELRLTVGSVRRLVRRGLLSALELPGGRLRFERASLERFLEDCRT